MNLDVAAGEVVCVLGPNGAGKTTLVRVASGLLTPRSGEVRLLGEPLAGRARSEVARLLAVVEQTQEISGSFSVRDVVAMGRAPHQGSWMRSSSQDERIIDDALARCDLHELASRPARALSGGEQKRLVLEALLRGPQEVLLLDEPDNALDVPTKRWLERRLIESPKTVLLVSHDRELLSRVPTHVATLEPARAGATVWVHGGTFVSYAEARDARRERLAELARRWDEEHQKLVTLVNTLKTKAAFNDGLASRYSAAQTRLRKFEEAGPPEVVAPDQQVRVRLRGGRTAKRAVVAERLELTGLMRPFDLEVWFGERVAVLGSNGSGKSHFLRLLAAGGTDPQPEQALADGELPIDPVPHTGAARLGSRVVPGFFAQNRQHAQDAAFAGRTLLEILHRGEGRRPGMGREPASKALDRYELVASAEQRYETLSGGQQARFHILLLELGGATLLLLDEPTDNLDLHSAEALEVGLAAFEGTVLAVTHDRWFARGFDRFLVFGADGEVVETPEPVWDSGRVVRARG